MSAFGFAASPQCCHDALLTTTKSSNNRPIHALMGFALRLIPSDKSSQDKMVGHFNTVHSYYSNPETPAETFQVREEFTTS